MRLALYEPDIPQNAGSLMRLGACLGVGIDVIEPCGFLLSDRNFRRAGMDYLKSADIRRHDSWAQFHAGLQTPTRQRLVLLTTQGGPGLYRLRLCAGRHAAGGTGKRRGAQARA